MTLPADIAADIAYLKQHWNAHSRTATFQDLATAIRTAGYTLADAEIIAARILARRDAIHDHADRAFKRLQRAARNDHDLAHFIDDELQRIHAKPQTKPAGYAGSIDLLDTVEQAATEAGIGLPASHENT